MSVNWAATSPTTGRYSGVYHSSSGAELLERVADLRTRGAGYLEIEIAGRDYPALSLAFAGDRAVLHLWSDEGRMALLGGDGSVPMDEDVEVPTMDDPDPGIFTGEFVSSTDRAVALLERFIGNGDAQSLGDWYDL